MDTYTASPVPDTTVRRLSLVQRAEAFVKAHLADPVPLEDLCRATGVSERTLRNAFHEVRGLSPKRYMLRARLEKARHALMSEKPATVTDVATEYGFYELGRFACRYRETFGESPSATLRAHAN